MKIILKFKIINSNLVIVFILFIAVLLFNQCANIGSPSGGPKDETPPEVISMEPENYTLNFDKKKIEIEFDEYVVLKNIQSELIISPPLDEIPEVKNKGKSIVIELNSELPDSTTFSFNFGNAISDNNEGNVLENFRYVFSTGDYLDSLEVAGILVDAFENEPVADVLVMLYTNLEDSAPILEKPVYIGKTNDKGQFKIQNIKETTYKVFALDDQNSNFLFDLPNEKIAFLDTFITPSVVSDIRTDTIKIVPDSLSKNPELADSLKLSRDSIFETRYNKYSPSDLTLYLFEEKEVKQYIEDYKRLQPSYLFLNFKNENTDTVKMKFLENEIDEDIFVLHSENLDTIKLWIKDTSLAAIDTLILKIDYFDYDSSKTAFETSDTLRFIFREKEAVLHENPDTMKLKCSIKNKSSVDLNAAIAFTSDFPFSDIDTSKIKLEILVDTIFKAINFKQLQTKKNPEKIKLLVDWTENSKYKILLLPEAFTDIYGRINDSLNISFNTKSIDTYGKLIMSISGLEGQNIIQFMTEKKELIRENVLDTSDIKIDYPYLKIADFKFKNIFDRNKNGKWDTGDYLKKIQAERTIFYEGEAKSRANWDIEIEWKLK